MAEGVRLSCHGPGARAASTLASAVAVGGMRPPTLNDLLKCSCDTPQALSFGLTQYDVEELKDHCDNRCRLLGPSQLHAQMSLKQKLS